MTFNVVSFLERAAIRWPNRPALFEDEAMIATYAALWQCARDIGRDFNAAGLEAGDRVALFSRNRARYLEILLGAWQAGLIPVPINARLHVKEASYIIENSGARLCLAECRDVGALKNALRTYGVETDVFDLNQSTEDWRAGDIRLTERIKSAGEIAWLFYTSGTTGRPKGVMLTHENLRQMVLNYLADADAIRPEDSIIHFAPLSHGSGLYALTHLAAGAANVVPIDQAFDLKGLSTLLACHKGVTMFMAPTMVRQFLDMPALDDLPIANLKTIVYGGGPMYVTDIEEAVTRLGPRFVQIYGQGESPMTISCLGRESISEAVAEGNKSVLGSVGRAFTGVEVAIAGAEGEPLPHGEIGEVIVRGPTVMRGYWADRQATNETIKNGWLHTGDIGTVDESGLLTLKDRVKDMIISGGLNIYPREVEEVLLRHNAVREAAVIGFPEPKWGESVAAFIVCARGLETSASELDAFCLDNLARFKRPVTYRFVEALPKNNYGKVLKRQLREQFTQIDINTKEKAS